jgi:hypothetical protein
MLIQAHNATRGFLLLLADTREVGLAVLEGIAGTLHIQLSFRESLLQLMDPLIDLRHASSDGLQSPFLTGFFRNPLSQLCLSRPSFLLEALNLQRAALCIAHQRVDPLGEVSQEQLQSGRVLVQRQGLHFLVTQGFRKTPPFLAP